MIELSIIQQAPADLIPYANNSRKHSAEQINSIASSIKEFGFLQPVIVDGAGIVAGHARVLAASKLGLPTIPTISASHLSPAQLKAFVIADNRLAELSTWDNDLLRIEMEALAEAGQDMSWLDMPDLAGLEAEVLPPVDADRENEEAPVVAVVPVVVPSELWQAGPHLVLCGDSTNPEHVERVLNGAKPNVCVTDPPYGVDYQPNWRNEALGETKGRSLGLVENDGKVLWSDALSLFTGVVFYVWHAGKYAGEVASSLTDLDFEIRVQLIWAKDNFAISRGHYHWQHEPCWYAVRKGQRSNWKGDRKSSTVWQVPLIRKNAGPDDQKTGHSTQKPVELYTRPYGNHCERGDHVYEPFLGSGTALVAAHKLGLVAHAIEISPAHVEAALSRFRTLTGIEPINVETGETLAELQARRGAS